MQTMGSTSGPTSAYGTSHRGPGTWVELRWLEGFLKRQTIAAQHSLGRREESLTQVLVGDIVSSTRTDHSLSAARSPPSTELLLDRSRGPNLPLVGIVRLHTGPTPNVVP